jgi:hypothetical protein
MQVGFTPGNSHLGTNLDVNMDTAANTSYAQAVFDQSLNQLEGVNERNIVYPKFSTALQGMTLTHVPSGGFSGPSPNILLGADVGGSMFNAANPTYFNQPGASAGIKRKEISNGVPLTGERPGAEVVYKTPDGKHRGVASTLARVEQEAAQGRRRMARAHANLLDDPTVPLIPPSGPPTTPPFVTESPRPRPLTTLPPPSLPPAATLATTGGKSVAAPRDKKPETVSSAVAAAAVIMIDVADMPAEKPDIGLFAKSLKKWAAGELPASYQSSFWSYNWPYLVCIILFILFIIVLLVAIATACKTSPIHQITTLRSM